MGTRKHTHEFGELLQEISRRLWYACGEFDPSWNDLSPRDRWAIAMEALWKLGDEYIARDRKEDEQEAWREQQRGKRSEIRTESKAE